MNPAQDLLLRETNVRSVVQLHAKLIAARRLVAVHRKIFLHRTSPDAEVVVLDQDVARRGVEKGRRFLTEALVCCQVEPLNGLGSADTAGAMLKSQSGEVNQPIWGSRLRSPDVFDTQ